MAGDLCKIMVSICCLTYNHEKLIKDALDGFLMQQATFPVEIVIHDDASTDGTPDIIREYAALHANIRPIFQDENQFSKTGRYPAASHLYPAARGKYIAECDGDDYWTDPLKLQKQFDFMEANPECSLCYHDYLIKDMKTGGMKARSGKAPRHYSGVEMIGLRNEGSGIHTSTKFWRNIYDDSTRRDFDDFHGDYPTNVLLGMHGSCNYVTGIQPSIYRRLHGGNSWSGMEPIKIKQLTADMYKRIFDAMVVRGNPEHIEIRRKFLRAECR